MPCFGGAVLSISLGSQCLLAMSRRGSDDKVDVLLEPGSLVVMAGEARYDWLHGIAPRKSDRIDGVTVPRGRRVSLTFRTVLVHPPV